MTDDERAALETERFQALALLHHQQGHAAMAGESAEFCGQCGNDIPAARRKALPGVTLCIGCKAAEELLERRR
ncbi:MAG: TraR/DksA C4-type zinc finger protein [Methylovulum sp.]|nr:TraR/DksA C4-type zinc finger protein [Methylovulum sp.]